MTHKDIFALPPDMPTAVVLETFRVAWARELASVANPNRTPLPATMHLSTLPCPLFPSCFALWC